MSNNQQNVKAAFAITCLAGLATALGASIVFFPKYIKYADRVTLAGALGLSAGVMTYVSFVEIFSKSIKSFVKSGFSDSEAYQYASCCFFAGVVVMVGLNILVTSFLKHTHDIPPIQTCASSDESTEKETKRPPAVDDAQHTVSPCNCCSDDPVGDLNKIRDMASEIESGQARAYVGQKMADFAGLNTIDEIQSETETGKAPRYDAEDEINQDFSNYEDDNDEKDAAEVDSSHEERKILSMSINTAIAIGLHNFPEGLATFVATLNDPKVGLVLGVAIAIHNIPEGLCVALPIYYATGHRWKAFWLALLSGMSEPFAALLGWLVLANSFSNISFGILFGIVAGMMVIISVRELLPTAHRYDPEDKIVTYCFMAGMAIMALSLILFTL